MDIRRIEPELIQPTPAGDRGPRIDSDRRQPDQQLGAKREHRSPKEDAEEQEPQGDDAASMVVYDQDGHVQEDVIGGETRHIDFRA